MSNHLQVLLQSLPIVNMVKKADMARNKSALSVAASEMSGYTGETCCGVQLLLCSYGRDAIVDCICR